MKCRSKVNKTLTQLSVFSLSDLPFVIMQYPSFVLAKAKATWRLSPFPSTLLLPTHLLRLRSTLP